jgi:hypothetical protein
VVGGAVIGPQTGPVPLVLLMLASSAVTILATFYVIHVASTVTKISTAVVEAPVNE